MVCGDRCKNHSLDQMCRENCCSQFSGEEVVSPDESLMLYCKPVELYNLLHTRFQSNPLFLPKNLNYVIEARREKKSKAGLVVFNYKDTNKILQKTEVMEDFSCPFCLMQCGSFKGLRLHLRSSHDLFEFDFWYSEDFHAVNVTMKLEALTSELDVPSLGDPQLHILSFCKRRLKRKTNDNGLNIKQFSVQFLELDSPNLANMDSTQNDGGKRDSQNGCHGAENGGSVYSNVTEMVDSLASSSIVASIPVVSHSSLDTERIRSSEPALPSVKIRKVSADKTESRNRMLLEGRQFYHSRRVQPMTLEEVLSELDSEDDNEADADIKDLEDRRILDDFVDVSKDEKQLMHLWNSFMRKQRVRADSHVPWTCKAFSKLHGKQFILSPPLFWSWRLFMVKLWGYGLLDGCTLDTCNSIVESFRTEECDTSRN